MDFEGEGFIFIILWTLDCFALENYLTKLNSFYFCLFILHGSQNVKACPAALEVPVKPSSLLLCLHSLWQISMFSCAAKRGCCFHLLLVPHHQNYGPAIPPPALCEYSLICYIQNPPRYLKEFKLAVWLHLDFAWSELRNHKLCCWADELASGDLQHRSQRAPGEWCRIS